MRSQSRLDEKTSKWQFIQDFKETAHVSDVTNNDISKSALRNLHVCDSAYDTLLRIDRLSKDSNQTFLIKKSVDNHSYYHIFPECNTDNEQNTSLSPVNKQNIAIRPIT